MVVFLKNSVKGSARSRSDGDKLPLQLCLMSTAVWSLPLVAMGFLSVRYTVWPQRNPSPAFRAILGRGQLWCKRTVNHR